MRIYIDIGHGENGDPGAVSGSFIEHQMNIVYATALAQRLAASGFIVDLEQGDLSIGDSARAAASLGADMLISCHENAGGGNRGEVIFGWGQGSEQLANVVAGALKAFGQSEVRTYQAKPNGAGNAEYFGILRVSRTNGVETGVIIEPCFIDNAQDAQLNDSNEKLATMGYAIADAIAEAYGGSTAFTRAVDRLAAKGIISTPDYWKGAIATGTDIRGEWMAIVIQGITGASTLHEGVVALAGAGIVKDHNYWLENCLGGRVVKAAYAKISIEKGVDKFGI